MSTNHTANYDLCQWVPSDKVLRVDFNEDNAKIDAALAKINTMASAAKTTADALASKALTLDNPGFVVGKYKGAADPDSTTAQKITLGFRPKLLFIIPTDGAFSYYGSSTFYVQGALYTQAGTTGGCSLEDDGFTAYNTKSSNHRHFLNHHNYSYLYLAMR